MATTKSAQSTVRNFVECSTILTLLFSTLCAYRWLRQVNDHGTSNDFTLYWKKITAEQKKVWLSDSVVQVCGSLIRTIYQKYDEECASLVCTLT